MKTIFLAASLLAIPFVGSGAGAAAYRAIEIRPAPGASEIQLRYAELLKERLERFGAADIAIGSGGPGGDLTILLGMADEHPELARMLDEARVRPPLPLDPGKEGYVVHTFLGGEGDYLLAAGFGERGVLYAVGEILRQAAPARDGIEIPRLNDIRRAPRFPVRGLDVVQGHTMRQLTGAREWTRDEWREAMLDYALAGANTIAAPARGDAFAVIQSYGLQTMDIVVANSGSGPEEWQAREAIGRKGYLCPSIPEAREALLEQKEKLFREMPGYDFVHFKSGDGGGCECERCAPYGRVFIRLCEDLAERLLRNHPGAKIFAGNQKLDNAGDMAIFEYMREKPREWLSGLCYGPGSNAMGWMPGRRQDHRMDLFEYAGFGALGGYLLEIARQMPPRHSILLFTDLTHWVYSQYGLMDHELIADRDGNLPPEWDRWMYEKRPDPALARVYDRRTFHARPNHYHKVFGETLRYAIGDVSYSEGHHDHFNQWMWQRLMWNPDRSARDLVAEYARAHFGPEAAPLMTEAVFQLEENLSTPIKENRGVGRLVSLVREAGWRMPEAWMRDNTLWRQYLQKALLDQYVQLAYNRQAALEAGVREDLERALTEGGLRGRLESAAEKLASLDETDEMRRLRGEAARLGEESNAIFGVRNEGLFNLEQDFVGLGWLRREVDRAIAAEDESAMRETAERIARYGDPGPGGFYDNAGVPGGAPRLTRGHPYGDGGFSGANRPSQRTMAFTTTEERGVTFEYRDLDPNARYRVRLTLVRPSYLPRFGVFQHQTRQSVYADDILLAEELELPEYEAEFFEFDIPAEAVRDGRLTLWMKKQDGIGEGPAPDTAIWRNTGGWGTLVSEAWLMKIAE